MEILKKLYRQIYVLGSHWKEYHLSFLDPVKSSSGKESVLDAGCGRGEVLNYFKEHSKDINYYGVDIGVGDEKWKFKVTAVADLHYLPFKNQSFDKVISNSVLEHVDNPNKVFSELSRVLKINGRIYLHVPMLWHLHQEPFDNFRFTIHGLRMLAKKNQLQVNKITPLGGYFTVLRYLIMNYTFIRKKNDFTKVYSKVFSKLVGILDKLLLAPLFYLLDMLDKEKKLTIGYFVELEKVLNDNQKTKANQTSSEIYTCPKCINEKQLDFIKDKDKWTCPNCNQSYDYKQNTPFLILDNTYDFRGSL